MTQLFDMDEATQREWDVWVSERPPEVQALARRFYPNILYRIKSTGQRVSIQGYNENGTLRVNVSSEHNLVFFERDVFGVSPDDLEEADLPGPDERVGALFENPDDISEAIDVLRPVIREMRGIQRGIRESTPEKE